MAESRVCRVSPSGRCDAIQRKSSACGRGRSLLGNQPAVTHSLTFFFFSGEADSHADHSFSKTILGGEHGHAEGGWLDTGVYMLTHAADSKRRLSSIHDIQSPTASLSHADSRRRLSSIHDIQSPTASLSHADSKRRLSSIQLIPSPTASPSHANAMLPDVVDAPQHKNERRGSIRRGHEASIAVNASAGRNLDGISKVVHHEKNDARGAFSSHE